MTKMCLKCGGELAAIGFMESVCMGCGKHHYGYVTGLPVHPRVQRSGWWATGIPGFRARADYPDLDPGPPKEFVTTEFERKFAVAVADLIIANHQKEGRA